MSSYTQLTDETFPASLLMEFDMLDDEIPISPPRTLEPDKASTAATEARSSGAASHTSASNTSSGNYSFSTENENGSSSSGSSNPSCNYRPTPSKRTTTVKDTKRVPSNATTKPETGQKKAKSLENLLNNAPPKIQTSTLKRQKYSHVKSKVKQFIDETTKKRDRQPLIRHKSMPEACMDCPAEEIDEIDHETDTDNLRTMLKEKTRELDSLKRHLNFCEMQREDNVFTIEALKRKIESMRLEHSKRDHERQREREMEREREKQAILNTYLRYSNPALNRIFASVSTQTSPEVHAIFNISSFQCDESFEEPLADSFPAPRRGPFARTSQHLVETEEDKPNECSEHEQASPDSATHPEGSPDYPPLLPAQGSCRFGRRVEENTNDCTQDYVEVCQKCIARKENKRKKKIRLASFFCIKKVKD
ncbi:uncharacterized protein LOC129721000 [Wyeomyia smithii]|uniref:uncharacterized protein LOC129721000 n=1 Tax=Wyeomyia smithii TaxID=174621 RepID=UPI002467EC48|nr:uncharacterized protein LOC129721000 [Wyeomyia smithii]